VHKWRRRSQGATFNNRRYVDNLWTSWAQALRGRPWLVWAAVEVAAFGLIIGAWWGARP
jgi:hypothetical protein